MGKTIIQTERLSLSLLSSEDAGELWDAIEGSREHLEEWLPFAVNITSPEVAERYCALSEKDVSDGTACRMLLRNAAGVVVGGINLENVNAENLSAEFSGWLCDGATGSGLGLEAASATLAWAFDKMGLHRIRGGAAVGNERSLKLQAKCGFQYEGLAREAECHRGEWLDHTILSLLASDHLAERAA